MSRLKEILAERVLCLDGAMGTAIQARDLAAADFGGADFDGCNENLNLTRPDVIESIHAGHLAAGADIIETNTFGSTDLVLAEYPPLQEQADELAIQRAMNNGACDLVSIGNKDRLQAVVTRELRALRVERALNSTIHSATEYKRQLKDYMHTSPDAIALVEEGIITNANDAWLKLFRAASSDEVLGLPLMDNFDSESQAAIKGALVAAIAGKWNQDEKLVAKSPVTGDDAGEVHLEFTKYAFDSAIGHEETES